MLGVCLAGGAIGAIVALPCINAVSGHLGSRHACLLGAIWCCIVLPSVSLGRGVEYLIPAIFLLGIGMAAVDVCISVQAVIYEKYLRITAMGQFFGIGNIGSVIGAMLGGVVAHYEIPVYIHFIGVSICCIPLCFVCHAFIFSKKEEEDVMSGEEIDPLLDDKDDKSNVEIKKKLCNGYVIYLSVVGLLATLGEGGLGDWTTLYFQESLNTGPLLASTAFAVFSGCIAVGRFFCDVLTSRLDRSLLLRLSGLLSGGGLVLVVLATWNEAIAVPLAFSGLALTGLTLSIVAPVVTSSAGKIPGIVPQTGISVVSGVTYLAFLVGPPMFGGLSYALGNLMWAMLVISCMLGCIAIIPGRVPRHELDGEQLMRECHDTFLIPPNNNYCAALVNGSRTGSSDSTTLQDAIFDTDTIVVRDSLIDM